MHSKKKEKYQPLRRKELNVDIFIRRLEEPLKGLPSADKPPKLPPKTHYRILSLAYLDTIERFLRSIYIREPISFHTLISYYVLRGLISKPLAENILQLHEEFIKLTHDSHYYVDKETAEKARSTAHQLLNEVKANKKTLENLLIEKRMNILEQRCES
jgi:hypothetical protein